MAQPVIRRSSVAKIAYIAIPIAATTNSPANTSGMRKFAEACSTSVPMPTLEASVSAITALLGALPLMLGSGSGSELRQPLGIAIVGGLLVSQVLTLFTTPVIYLAFDRVAVALTGRQPNLNAGDAAAPAE